MKGEQLSIFEFIEEKPKPKGFNYDTAVKYVLDKYEHECQQNDFRKNMILDFLFPKSLKDCTRYDDLEHEWKLFKKIFDSFCYHYFSEAITIMSWQLSGSYHVFAIPKNDPFIVEFPPIDNLLKDELCAPACAINWLNKDGTKATDYLVRKENEILTDEIRQPVDTKQMNFSEWRRDRREYYFFNILKIHKFGKSGRVDKNQNYDCFTNYTWTLPQMVEYYKSVYGGE